MVGKRRPASPAIFFLSDYGTADEFVGIVHAVLHHLAPGVPVIDISHQIPPFDIAAGASMLVRCAPYFRTGVVLAVVDPGVGTARRAVALRTPGPAWLVGPDNGLLTPVAAALGGAEEALVLAPADRSRQPPGDRSDEPGPTFDGRDVFAPAAAHLVLGGDPALLGAPTHSRSLLPASSDGEQGEPGESARTGPVAVASVVSIDRFGNVQLGLGPGDLEELGLPPDGAAEVIVGPGPGPFPPPEPGAPVVGGGPAVPARRVVAFADLGEGELGLMVDSSGRMALVLDRASAAGHLHLTGPGAEIRISPA